jgi:excisionase family DNA binding protein
MDKLAVSETEIPALFSSADRLMKLDNSRAHPVKLLLTVPEAAVALGIGRSLVYQLLLSQQIHSVKIGRARRIPLTVLEGFIAQRLDDQCCGEL